MPLTDIRFDYNGQKMCLTIKLKELKKNILAIKATHKHRALERGNPPKWIQWLGADNLMVFR